MPSTGLPTSGNQPRDGADTGHPARPDIGGGRGGGRGGRGGRGKGKGDAQRQRPQQDDPPEPKHDTTTTPLAAVASNILALLSSGDAMLAVQLPAAYLARFGQPFARPDGVKLKDFLQAIPGLVCFSQPPQTHMMIRFEACTLVSGPTGEAGSSTEESVAADRPAVRCLLGGEADNQPTVKAHSAPPRTDLPLADTGKQRVVPLVETGKQRRKEGERPTVPNAGAGTGAGAGAESGPDLSKKDKKKKVLNPKAPSFDDTNKVFCCC
jgi:hypothetical protein